MTIEAKVIEDSISTEGIRLVTMQLRYPRLIHAEFMTHRVFSRNASSSRAIPVEKMIADLRADPAMPVYWGANQKGMQAAAELEPNQIEKAKKEWLLAMNRSICSAEYLVALGLHKQIANRILEPWGHISVVVTATEWSNFFELRCHPDAQPEMRTLAETMKAAFDEGDPRLLFSGEWHLPYVDAEERIFVGDYLTAIKLSVARCARVSYLTHDKKVPNIGDDLALYERLVGSRPIHASPAEHQATPDTKTGPDQIEPRPRWEFGYEHGNFVGWRQYRKQLERLL